MQVPGAQAALPTREALTASLHQGSDLQDF
ncbi:hypothetical protein NITHO_810010 [Nitrolancea hollandica Lb]|uniref:Uncharacterized protein n=1 Tax=Nitrolancea hollandica Lb TaxID=1129897 RepID=I4ENA3_9BACT|nr:hypothetical protein NITHO_810010 [Nitrolancea hollandica Lb]